MANLFGALWGGWILKRYVPNSRIPIPTETAPLVWLSKQSYVLLTSPLDSPGWFHDYVDGSLNGAAGIAVLVGAIEALNSVSLCHLVAHPIAKRCVAELIVSTGISNSVHKLSRGVLESHWVPQMGQRRCSFYVSGGPRETVMEETTL